MKICSVCKEEKPFSDFYNLRNTKDGKSCRCKECDKLAVKGQRKRLGKAYWLREQEYKRKHKYGLDKGGFDKMLKSQEGRCAICEIELQQELNTGSRAVVDHCHNSSVVRGILCANCNRGLGFLGDTYENLTKALKYMKKYKEKENGEN